MEGSGSECSEAEASSWTRKLELPTFDGIIEGETDSKGNSFECDDDPLQFLKLENTSKEGSVIKNHAPCCGEETKNEAKLARETANGKVMMEEEVDPLIKKEKHKENRVKNVDCEDHFLDNPIPKLIKKEVETGDAAKPHSFQDSDFHKKIVMMKHKSLLDPNSIMKVVGTSMVLESFNVNLLAEPLALNFVVPMDDRSTMEPRPKECTEAVMMVQVIRSPPSSPPPPKLPDLSLYEVASGFTKVLQIAAIVALSRYSIVGFKENAIAMVSHCGLHENRNRGRLTHHGISLCRGCCIVGFRKGQVQTADSGRVCTAIQSCFGLVDKRSLVEMMCSFFVASWTGVVKYHGPRPSRRPKQVFVANHTSMIDFIILEQMTAFAVIMQKHPGWVGLLQSTILESLGCIWFNRTEAKDREIVARKLRDHVQGADNNPLLIFPEGTCVNNHYTVMFKKGAFELGCTVCPVAIKYNKIFVDAFWNSRKQSFTMHLLQLMTSWAVVCDVWYLEPQNLKPGETPIEFAERVRDIISVRAGLKKVPWDGYLKYSRPSPKHRERKQQNFAESVLRRWEEK
ncbi:hypothetical protein D0Y65_023911 [Glycine soja]|uniref:Phospholipid/glycerol acyltransferase domain-containing protein n=2 Tax=Glycine soja TaxID=3848 RepID=A0A445J036_GLYSO|nr:hypothetical protein D0Y65_023911 [Glycine soja]